MLENHFNKRIHLSIMAATLFAIWISREWFQTIYYMVWRITVYIFICRTRTFFTQLDHKRFVWRTKWTQHAIPVKEKLFSWMFWIARALRTKAKVICKVNGKRQCFSIFYEVNMSIKSKIDSEFSPVSFGKMPNNLANCKSMLELVSQRNLNDHCFLRGESDLQNPTNCPYEHYLFHVENSNPAGFDDHAVKICENFTEGRFVKIL